MRFLSLRAQFHKLFDLNEMTKVLFEKVFFSTVSLQGFQ